MSDPRPINCRYRLQDEGKSYPRSSCPACGRTITTGLGNRCYLERSEPVDKDAEIATLRAREAELVEALELIASLSAGGPHISAKEGMGAAFVALDRARAIAGNMIARVRTEKGETT